MRPRLLLILMLSFGIAGATQGKEDTITFGRFGTVTLYQTTMRPSEVVLFVSGDGGWNRGVVDMARELSSLGTLVAGIDITYYLRELEKSGEECVYPAADFEALSKVIQKKLDFPQYVIPVLVGYSSGATLVYGAAVQAPPNTFKGAISLGFCPDLMLTKPVCRGYGLAWEPGPQGKGVSFLPATNLRTPWVALQGTIDQVCDPPATIAYVKQVKGGEIVILPKVGHGFSVPRNWMPQFKETFLRLAKKDQTDGTLRASTLKDLPLIEINPQRPSSPLMALIISGDGGWAGIDRDLGNILAGRGIPVVGLNSLQYFWRRRTPEESAQDLTRVLTYYFTAWQKEKVILIGYSLGADVLPFMAARLSKDLLDRTALIALLGPDETVDFEFHLTDWLGGSSGSKAAPVLPEVEKLSGRRVLCFCGEKETGSLCRKLDPNFAKVIVLKGSHHFGGNYEAIADAILNEYQKTVER